MSVASPGYFDRKPSSAQVRPGLAHLQADPSSPRTPQRAISSTLSSPSVSYRAEEEPLVFEFGARHFCAGFAGESYPRCTLGFGPEESRRVGDYRRWLPGWEGRPKRKRRVEWWGDDHELWCMDVRGLDMGLVEDKIERAVREAYTKYLLLDYKSTKKLILILPSVMPHQLLNLILNKLFQGSPAPPAITLLSPPALATAAAGCRSSLIVDIGWRETIFTAVCEYREVQQWRTTRAMRMIVLEMARMLERQEQSIGQRSQTSEGNINDTLMMDLEKAEEITMRLAWCRSRRAANGGDSPVEDPSVSIPSPSSSRKSLQVPFSAFARPVENTLLPDTNARHLDDHEQPLGIHLYNSLLSMPPDVRSLCMSRIIFTGGGSNIPGLKTRLLEEVSALLEERGWDPVFGTIADACRAQRKELASSAEEVTPKLNGGMNGLGIYDSAAMDAAATKLPPHLDPRLPDFVDEKFLKGQEGRTKPNVPLAGFVRSIETLGAWAGASLLATLRIKGIVEIERDTYLQYGLAGARKDATDVSVVAQKGLAPTMPKAGERVSWTLGAWA